MGAFAGCTNGTKSRKVPHILLNLQGLTSFFEKPSPRGTFPQVNLPCNSKFLVAPMIIYLKLKFIF